MIAADRPARIRQPVRLALWLSDALCRLASRPDLDNRAIFLILAPIAEAQRRPENELWRGSKSRARISSVPVAVVHGLRGLGGIHLDGCRAWPISLGPRLVRHSCGPPARSLAPMQQPQDRDRGRSGRGMRTGTYGRAQRMDGQRRRPFTCSRFCRGRGLEEKRRLAKKRRGRSPAGCGGRPVFDWAGRRHCRGRCSRC
jgi:hypothetical protein